MLGVGITSQIIYFDISALIILLVIFYSVIYRKIIVGIANKTFAIVAVCVFICTLFDTCNALFSLKINFLWADKNLVVRYICLYGYFICRNLCLPLYEVYLVVVSSGFTILKKKKWLVALFWVPYFVILGLLTGNLFLHNVFYIDEFYSYTRGPFALSLYIAAAFYMIMGIVILVYYKKGFPRDKFISLLTMIPLNVVAVAIQFFWPKYLVECFFTTISVLLITFTVQRPEENVDVQLGTFTNYAFKDEAQKNFNLNNKFSIVVVGIKNYEVIKSILSTNIFEKFMVTIASTLNKIKKDSGYVGNLYHFDHGIFAFLSVSDNEKKTDLVASKSKMFFSDIIKIDKVNLQLETTVCVIECPRDFTDYDSLSSFINKYQGFFSDINDIIKLEKHSENINYKVKSEINDIITRGIKNHGFTIFYQPIYSTEEKKFISAEALVRLQDEKWGFVSPEIFIAAAEKNGTILHIGKVVIEEVCKFIASPVFKELGLKYVEINLSVAQCLQSDLVDTISSIMKKYDVKPDQINFEITERETIFDQKVFEDNLEKLKELGFSFSLDDYGTGYSNIRRIVQMPLDIVKIDKSFVDEYQNKQMQSIIENTVKMLKEINKKIVVEGIETKEAFDVFSNLQCDYIQGYYFSKPLNQEDFIAKVREMNK